MAVGRPYNTGLTTAVCKNRRLYAKEPKITHFAIASILQEQPSYSPFIILVVIIKSTCNYLFSSKLVIYLLFIALRLLLRKL